jgi:hypothetical protein
MKRRALALLASSFVGGCAGEAPAPAPPPTPTLAEPPPVAKRAKVPYEDPGGMWPPTELGAHAAKLKELGLEIDPAALTDPLGFPLGAVVSLGNCSASFVSDDGLVITNHHCAVQALQYNSTTAENLYKDGFHAKGRADERFAGPTQHLYVTRAFRDVTREVRDGLEAAKDDAARYKLVEDRVKALVAACEKGRPSVRCSVPAYYGGAEYVLIEQLDIPDLRIVFAPPASLGDFGGEVDNWRWPRHASDFAIYRAYVGPDQQPAPHAAANVPFKPPKRLHLASSPLEAGDLVLVAGYPGRTNRLRVAAEVGEALSFTYPHQMQVFEEGVALLEKVSTTNAITKIKATPTIRQMNNVLGKDHGLVDGLTKGGLAQQKAKLESDLRAFIDGDPARKAKYGDAIAKIDAIVAARDKTRDESAFLAETQRYVRLFDAALTIVRMAEERPKPDAERDPAFQERNWRRIDQDQIALERRFDRAIDTGLLALGLARDAKLDKARRSPLLAMIAGKGEPTQASIERGVEQLYAGTKLADTKVRLELLHEATSAELAKSADTMVRLAVAARALYKASEARDHAVEGALLLARPRFVEALRAFLKTPVAPDANSTLRVTYGTVRGYRPKPDAPVYAPFTTADELAAKNTGKDPFDAPKVVLDAIHDKRWGAYSVPGLGGAGGSGEVPIDFLADLDITGGNSGSATLNAKGEIVGLVFDGNYEAMASDWLFMPNVTRSIHVDIRCVLWLLDEVFGAKEITAEMRR